MGFGALGPGVLKYSNGNEWLLAGADEPAPVLPVTDGLHAHYDADALALDNNDAVASWNDRSGNSRHAVQATASKRPTFKAAMLNGRPVVEFDGVDDLLATATWTALSQPNTIFVVGRRAEQGRTDFFFDGVSSSNRHQFTAQSNNQWRISGDTNVTGGSTDTNPHVFTAVFNGGSSSLRVDASQVLSGNAGSNTLTGLALGVNSLTNETAFLKGYLAEVILYSRALTTQERDDVEAFLAAKWGL